MNSIPIFILIILIGYAKSCFYEGACINGECGKNSFCDNTTNLCCQCYGECLDGIWCETDEMCIDNRCCGIPPHVENCYDEDDCPLYKHLCLDDSVADLMCNKCRKTCQLCDSDLCEEVSYT